MAEENNLTRFAREELTRAGMFEPDSAYAGGVGEAVLKLIEAVGDEHSGGSIALTVAAFEKLIQFEPLTPLTGEDDEWVEVTEGLFQNKRCSRVFKDNSGVYDIDGRVFRDPDGSMWTNGNSRVPVTFPYTPVTEIVDRLAEE